MALLGSLSLALLKGPKAPPKKPNDTAGPQPVHQTSVGISSSRPATGRQVEPASHTVNSGRQATSGPASAARSPGSQPPGPPPGPPPGLSRPAVSNSAVPKPAKPKPPAPQAGIGSLLGYGSDSENESDGEAPSSNSKNAPVPSEPAAATPRSTSNVEIQKQQLQQDQQQELLQQLRQKQKGLLQQQHQQHRLQEQQQQAQQRQKQKQAQIQQQQEQQTHQQQQLLQHQEQQPQEETVSRDFEPYRIEVVDPKSASAITARALRHPGHRGFTGTSQPSMTAHRESAVAAMEIVRPQSSARSQQAWSLFSLDGEELNRDELEPIAHLCGPTACLFDIGQLPPWRPHPTKRLALAGQKFVVTHEEHDPTDDFDLEDFEKLLDIPGVKIGTGPATGSAQHPETGSPPPRPSQPAPPSTNAAVQHVSPAAQESQSSAAEEGHYARQRRLKRDAEEAELRQAEERRAQFFRMQEEKEASQARQRAEEQRLNEARIEEEKRRVEEERRLGQREEADRQRHQEMLKVTEAQSLIAQGLQAAKASTQKRKAIEEEEASKRARCRALMGTYDDAAANKTVSSPEPKTMKISFNTLNVASAETSKLAESQSSAKTDNRSTSPSKVQTEAPVTKGTASKDVASNSHSTSASSSVGRSKDSKEEKKGREDSKEERKDSRKEHREKKSERDSREKRLEKKVETPATPKSKTAAKVGWLPEGTQCIRCSKKVAFQGGVYCGRQLPGCVKGCGEAVCWKCMNRAKTDEIGKVKTTKSEFEALGEDAWWMHSSCMGKADEEAYFGGPKDSIDADDKRKFAWE